jgi:hypothetical protein
MYTNSSLADSNLQIYGIKVTGFSEGSIIVRFEILFRTLKQMTNLEVGNVFVFHMQLCTDCEGPTTLGEFTLDSHFTMFGGK